MLKAVRRKSRWGTISFVDQGYQGDEAQRTARMVADGARVPHRAEIGEGENRPRLNFESGSQKQLDAAKQSQSQYTNLLGSVSGAGHERFQSGVPVSIAFIDVRFR